MKLFLAIAILSIAAVIGVSCSGTGKAAPVVEASGPATTSSVNEQPGGTKIAVLAGGCFWGLEAVFEHVKGVKSVVSGYSGGDAATADYETVSDGKTGHAESVQITYDPTQVSYEQLLQVYFSVATDPTELNRQGPDTGTQYRSEIFYTDDDQKTVAENYIKKLTDGKVYSKPIVTLVAPLTKFYPAEDYHQNYLDNHPNEPYIVYNDKPKVAALKKNFADLWVEKSAG